MTKVMGRHTMKAGFYNNHSFKAQNVGAGGGLSFQGTVDFGNDTNNALDTGFGYANAATGVFTRYQQASDFIEGQMIYDNTEFYVQDNWKVNSRLTLDYGVRFTRQSRSTTSTSRCRTSSPSSGAGSQAPVLYVPGCSNGATICSGNALQRHGSSQRPDPDGAGRGQHPGGDRHPDSRLRQPAERHPPGGRRHREDRLHVAGARRRAALRRGLRPDRQPDHGAPRLAAASSTTVRTATPSSRSRATRRSPTRADLRNGQLQTLDAGPQHPAEPAAGDLPVRREGAGASGSGRRACRGRCRGPWPSTSRTSATTASTGWARFRAATTVNLNAVDIGAAYLPQNQDPTRAASTRSRRDRAGRQPAAAVSGPGQHQPEHRPSSGTPTTHCRRR